MATGTTLPGDVVRFPTPFVLADYQGTGFPMRTLLEVKLDKFSHSIRTKPQWWRKVHDEAIVSRWRTEAGEQDVPAELFEFGIKQLRHLSKQCTEDGIRPSPVRLAFESDAIVDGKLRDSLLQALRPLEEVPEANKDWHPGSEKQVLDLVHPSLYPLVLGVSRSIPVQFPALSNSLVSDLQQQCPPAAADTVPNEAATSTSDFRVEQAQAGTVKAAFGNWKKYMGTGEILPVPEENGRPRDQLVFHSDKFQWLPADIAVTKDGTVKFLSYMNNVHPEWHKPLYPATLSLIQRCIPLFERVLAAVAAPVCLAIVPPIEFWGPDFDVWRALKKRENPDWESDSDDSYALYEEEREFQEPKVPEEFVAPSAPPCVSLRGRTIQVIVKYASIVLTPESPEFQGGVWHVEGMENENIVASAIAYLRCDNITTSRLAFRSMVDEPDYEQSDHEGVARMYGFEDDDTLNDPLGAVDCEEGRVVAFPNVLQHCVQPFHLADASKPGLRTIAALFLVDPNSRILSTSDVPPQQSSWHDAASGLRPLFTADFSELLDKKRDFPMSLETAKEIREELMHERKYLQEENQDEWFEREFSLCEH